MHKKPNTTAQEVIELLNLEPMPGEACPGFYLFTYESDTRANIDKDRTAASLIYYLMTPDYSLDPWHMNTSDEILLYHAGAPLIQLLLYPDGRWEEVVLGPEIHKSQVMQKVIPAGTWMGFVKMQDPDYDWGLYGVMLVPGFHIDDQQVIKGENELKALMEQYPGAVKRGRELELF